VLAKHGEGCVKYLVLIEADLVDGSDNARCVQTEGHETDDDTKLVAEDRPAEMDERVERDEAADADADEHEADRNRRPHPRLDRAQVRVVVRVEVFQTLDGLAHLDVPHPSVQHLNDDDQERGHRLDDAVCKVQRLRRFVLPQVQCLLNTNTGQNATQEIYLFIYYTVYTRVQSFTIVKNRKCGQVTSHCRKAHEINERPFCSYIIIILLL